MDKTAITFDEFTACNSVTSAQSMSKWPSSARISHINKWIIQIGDPFLLTFPLFCLQCEVIVIVSLIGQTRASFARHSNMWNIFDRRTVFGDARCKWRPVSHFDDDDDDIHERNSLTGARLLQLFYYIRASSCVIMLFQRLHTIEIHLIKCTTRAEKVKKNTKHEKYGTPTRAKRKGERVECEKQKSSIHACDKSAFNFAYTCELFCYLTKTYVRNALWCGRDGPMHLTINK